MHSQDTPLSPSQGNTLCRMSKYGRSQGTGARENFALGCYTIDLSLARRGQNSRIFCYSQDSTGYHRALNGGCECSLSLHLV